MKNDVASLIRDINESLTHMERDLNQGVRNCKDPLLEAFSDNFASQSAAGVSWPPRKDTGFGHPLLNKSGALMAAATQSGASGHIERLISAGETISLELGVDTTSGRGGVPGAAVHNFGATITPVDKQYLSWIDSEGTRRFAKQVTIPQREFLVVADETLNECGEILADAMINEVVS
jgi:phage gpG-like protein